MKGGPGHRQDQGISQKELDIDSGLLLLDEAWHAQLLPGREAASHVPLYDQLKPLCPHQAAYQPWVTEGLRVLGQEQAGQGATLVPKLQTTFMR